MQQALDFYGSWSIKVTKLERGQPAGPRVRLVIQGAGAADGVKMNPPPGTLLQVDGAHWSLMAELSFDFLSFRRFDLERVYSFDPQEGLTATIDTKVSGHVFFAGIQLHCISRDPALRSRLRDKPFDFTYPEGTRRREGSRRRRHR